MHPSKTAFSLVPFILLTYSPTAQALPPPPAQIQEPTVANPVCGSPLTFPVSDITNIYNQLLAVPVQPGQDPEKTCWTAPDGDCNLLQASGEAKLMMCGYPKGQQFASCEKLAYAVYDLIIDCQKDYEVGGSVAIPYLKQVTLELLK